MHTEASLPPFAGGTEHALLQRFVGAWAGRTGTWFDPDGDPTPGEWRLAGETLLGGRFVRLSYAGTVGDKPHAGEMLLAYEQGEKRYTVVWTDSFHNGSQVMVCHGPSEWASQGARGDQFEVLGSYPAGEERWGWRMRLRRLGDQLTIAMLNIGPDGREFPAVDVKLSAV